MAMTKVAKKSRSLRVPATAWGNTVIGETRDGVLILKPASKPKSFSIQALKKAIAKTQVASKAHAKKAN
jgi:hypothetical protein